MENPELRHAFQAKPFTETYVNLFKCLDDSLNYNFGIQMFLRTVQILGEIAVEQALSE
jgi:hypothetical protein